MPLNFQPLPYKNPELTGSEQAQQIGGNLSNFGQILMQLHQQSRADEDADLARRIQIAGVADKYGTVGARKILRPNAPPRKILGQSSQVNLNQPMSIGDQPLESFDLSQPDQFSQARRMYGSAGTDPYLAAQNAGLDRRFKESQIAENESTAWKNRNPSANNKKTFIGNSTDGKPLFADADGNVSLGDVPGGGAIYPKNLTDAQSNAAGYGDRAASSHQIIENLVAGGKITPSSAKFGAQEMKYTPNLLKSGYIQSFDQAKRNFLNAILRRESGAVISPSEFEEGNKQYFPVFGDTPETMKQKAENRAMQIKNLSRAAGPAMRGQGGGTSAGAKPKTVQQNGHTYTLNEATGQYE